MNTAPSIRTPSEIQRDVAANIKAIREARGLRQVDVAKLAHVAVGSISYLEAGTLDCRLSSLARLARGLNMDIRELLAPR